MYGWRSGKDGKVLLIQHIELQQGTARTKATAGPSTTAAKATSAQDDSLWGGVRIFLFEVEHQRPERCSGLRFCAGLLFS